MSTPISSTQKNSQSSITPECDMAAECCWFEKTIAASSRCANRNSMVCHKKCADIFAPFDNNHKNHKK